jgi:hypothetical protein
MDLGECSPDENREGNQQEPPEEDLLQAHSGSPHGHPGARSLAASSSRCSSAERARFENLFGHQFVDLLLPWWTSVHSDW